MWTHHGHMAGWDEMGECGFNMDTGLGGMRWESVGSIWTLGWMG